MSLAYDSYYHDAQARVFFQEKERRYTASCNAGRFTAETALLHKDLPDEVGQWRSIYNETLVELMTYHNDPQKGVGKKYNISRGLIRSTAPMDIRNNDKMIPGYDVYKSMFEACDNFNRWLHDKTWPYRRGGGGSGGENGNVHDFLFAVLLHNTLNLADELDCWVIRDMSFREQCIELSNEVFEYASIGIV